MLHEPAASFISQNNIHKKNEAKIKTMNKSFRLLLYFWEMMKKKKHKKLNVQPSIKD